MINDNTFMQKESASSSYEEEEIRTIVRDGTKLNSIVGLDEITKDDPFEQGTHVEFNTPDGTSYRGHVASKSGDDYIVQVSKGESYIVPLSKLARVTVEHEQIKEALGRYVDPEISVISDPQFTMQNRCVVRVAYSSRLPTDSEIQKWANDYCPTEWRLVDAIRNSNRELGLVFEVEAAADPKPQGGDQQSRGEPLSSEEIEGHGRIDAKPINASFSLEEITAPTVFSMEAQMGEPGSADQYEELQKAAEWVLARFNDSNPDFYAVPQNTEAAGVDEDRVVRLYFNLNRIDEEDNMSHVYVTRSGQIVNEEQPGSSHARGYVQVDGKANVPMIMLESPQGPESVQEYGFDMFAKLADMVASMADDVLASYGGYTADAQSEFEARLTKLAVDPKAKKYWKKYFKEYGEMWTRDIPRKTFDRKSKIVQRWAQRGRRRKYDQMPDYRQMADLAVWALEAGEQDEKLMRKIYSVVQNYLGKYPLFTQTVLKKPAFSPLTPDDYAKTLTFAIAENRKLRKDFMKAVSSWTTRYKKDRPSWKFWEKPQRFETVPFGKKEEQPTTEPEVVKPESKPEPQVEEVVEPQVEEHAEPEVAEEPEISEEQFESGEMLQQPPAVPQEEWVVKSPSFTGDKGKKSMKKLSDAAPGPWAYNAPGKDDRKDHDYKENRVQPSRNRTRFKVERMYTTSSSDDNGYATIELSWNPKDFAMMSDRNIMHQIVSFMKGMESDKYFHDLGVMGKPKIMFMDTDAGVARVKIRCSETRGIPTLTYSDDDKVDLKGIY